ncbi:Regulator of drug sensitivity 2 [Nakaseomyces glabratus]|nr:Regulator of drug sensitivity 2 [Nakaseomyces glabratus]KTB16685.1 Regulator of drug sensitivity 2 [Nakaseomyces glabratus]
MEEPAAKKQKKLYKSCIFCRRSHVNCDHQRPCSRCIKREIGHLCVADENVSNIQSQYQYKNSISPIGSTEIPNAEINIGDETRAIQGSNSSVYGTETPISSSNNNLLLPPQPNFVSENVGSEFSSLNEFLMMLENPIPGESENTSQSNKEQERTAHSNLEDSIENTQEQTDNNEGIIGSVSVNQEISQDINEASSKANGTKTVNEGQGQEQDQEHNRQKLNKQESSNSKAQSDKYDDTPTSKEQFFLTAADPSTEMNPVDRLKLVINAKLEAGLLKPYDYAKGYARLQEYMDKYMNDTNKQRILKPLMSIRPAFRTIAKSLKDVDLVLVEESFERMLLSYDRVFTSMSMPACLWRRTGEIYRANKEFASLVDCTVDDLRDGKLAIYELMTEESAVNFWEKYGSIAFDKGQKAVLTSCSLRTKDGLKKRPCCFSFTIRRDRYNIPICIVGNFIPLSPTRDYSN